MNDVFEDLAERLGRAPLWIDFEQYAATVFAGAPTDWYRDGNRYAATLAQARSLLRSDLISVPVLGASLAEGGWNDSAADGASAADALDALLSRAGPKRFLADALDALFHRFTGKAELVLELPSPSRLLRLRGGEAPFDFGDMDDIASALTAVLRELSGRDFRAACITCDEPDGLSDDEQEAIEPLVKAARYYGWGVAVRLDGLVEAQAPERGDADVVLLRQWSDAAVTVLGPWAAGGLTESFWRDPGIEAPSTGALHFGTVPADAVPEVVARRINGLLG